MRRSLLIAISVLLLLGLVVIVVVLRRSRPQETSRRAEATKLVETLPPVAPPPQQPAGEYDARIHGDEDSVPEDWFTKHPIYSFIPAEEAGFYIEPTGKLFELRVTLRPKAKPGDRAREAELERLQTKALEWIRTETAKLDPKSEAAKAYPKWRENHPARDFDQRRGIKDLKIIWQQSK